MKTRLCAPDTDTSTSMHQHNVTSVTHCRALKARPWAIIRVCVCVCVCVCDAQLFSTNSIAFANIHHLSTALFALQQCLDFTLRAAFPPSLHDSKAMYGVCIAMLTMCSRAWSVAHVY